MLLAVLAGAINGLFALPMKINRRWAWENNWLLFSLLSLVIFPWLIAFLSVPDLKVGLFDVLLREFGSGLFMGSSGLQRFSNVRYLTWVHWNRAQLCAFGRQYERHRSIFTHCPF